MSLPGFLAEASLRPASTTYRSAAAGRAPTGLVSPAQVGHEVFLVTTRCCQYVPSFGRFVCTERRHPPFVQCTCHRLMFGPVIICQDPVIGF